jgi:hypothetical protein
MVLLTFFVKRATRRPCEQRLCERDEVVKFFVDREARLLASFDRTLRLPFP